MKPSQEAAVAGSQAIGAKRGPLGVRCSGSENQNDRAAKLPVADEGAKQVKGPRAACGTAALDRTVALIARKLLAVGRPKGAPRAV